MALPYKSMTEIRVVAKGNTFNDQDWALVLTKNPPGSGCTGKRRWCPGMHPGCCTWQECQLWNNTSNGSQTLLWNSLSPDFKAIIFSGSKSLFLGNKSCDWDPTLRRIHPSPGEFLPHKSCSHCCCCLSTENIPTQFSHIKKKIILKILLQSR